MDNRIIEKLRKYYGLSTQSYIQSSKFHTLLDHNVRKIGERNSDVYLCIQEVLHELETNRSDSSKKVRKLERWLAVLNFKPYLLGILIIFISSFLRKLTKKLKNYRREKSTGMMMINLLTWKKHSG